MVMKFCGWIDFIKGSAVHMNRNSCLLNFLVVALCLFSYLNFVRSIPCFGVYNVHIFSVLNNFKLGTACYTLQ